MSASDDTTPAAPAGELVLYTTDDGQARIECRFVGDSIWLTQALIAELYDKDVRTISEHLNNIFEEGEVDPQRTIRKFRIVRAEGALGREVARVVEHYHLEAILAVGYRVRSARGTQFRRWATERLSEYLIKGFVLDDQRLKNPAVDGRFAGDHFDELLARIRDIRASERRMYLRVRDIFTMAADYAPSAAETTRFYQTIQNKLHFATTGQTAAALIKQRASASAPHMGLTSWKGADVARADVTIAKNYLSAAEIDELNRVVVMWLDFAEDQARRRQQVFLRDWEQRLDEFLRFNDRSVLHNAGTVSQREAQEHATAAYEQFAAQRRALLEAETERDLEATLRATADSVARAATHSPSSAAGRRAPKKKAGPSS